MMTGDFSPLNNKENQTFTGRIQRFPFHKDMRGMQIEYHAYGCQGSLARKNWNYSFFVHIFTTAFNQGQLRNPVNVELILIIFV